MKRVKTGWVAETHDARGFSVGGETPTGVYVYSSVMGVTLHDAGLKKAEPNSFKMPADTALLRDLAQCLEAAADDIDRQRGK